MKYIKTTQFQKLIWSYIIMDYMYSHHNYHIYKHIQIRYNQYLITFIKYTW